MENNTPVCLKVPKTLKEALELIKRITACIGTMRSKKKWVPLELLLKPTKKHLQQEESPQRDTHERPHREAFKE